MPALKEYIHRARKSQNVKNGVLYTVFSFINNGINFILILILANYLLPADYGYLNLYNTLFTLLSLVIALSTTSYIGNAFFQKSRREMTQVLLFALMVASIGLLLLLGVVFLFKQTVSELIGIPFYFIFLCVLCCYFQVFTNVNLDIWRLEERPVSYGIFSLSYALLNFVFTFVLIIGLKQGWEGRVYAQTLVTGSFFIASIIFLIRRHYLVFELPPKGIILETLLFALPIIPHSISFWLKQGLDRYIINYYHEASDVGLYSFALNFAAVITIVGNAFNSTNSVYILKNLSKGYSSVKQKLQRQNRVMTILFFLIAIATTLITTMGVPFILPKYSGSTSYIFPLCIGAFFQCVYLLYVNYLFFYKKTKNLMYITLSTSLLQMALSLWLTKYSIMYTAYISMGVACVMSLIIVHQSKRVCASKSTSYNER